MLIFRVWEPAIPSKRVMGVMETFTDWFICSSASCSLDFYREHNNLTWLRYTVLPASETKEVFKPGTVLKCQACGAKHTVRYEFDIRPNN